MRVADTPSTARARTDSARSDRFAAALREARRRERPAAVDPAVAREASPAASALTRRAAAGRKDAALDHRREEYREEVRQSPVQGSGVASARANSPEAAASPELRALVRALPPAIEAARVREGEPLALAFGSALSVELTAAPGGVEIVLRPGAELARGARLELPRIVDALRRRGVSVAGAEVLPRAHATSADGLPSLTGPAPSARTAARHGTVAKW